jgi:hypothetical protein
LPIKIRIQVLGVLWEVMEVLLSLVAPSLNKSLEICFLTGFATAYKLQAVRTLKGGVLYLPKKKQARRQSPMQPNASSLSKVKSTVVHLTTSGV